MQVRSSLESVLQKVDWEQATERTVRDEVAKELGKPVDEHKNLIKAAPAAFPLLCVRRQPDLCCSAGASQAIPHPARSRCAQAQG